jgi:hypothetical protein
MNYGGVREGYGVTWPQRHEFPVTFSLEMCWPDGGRMVGSANADTGRGGRPAHTSKVSRCVNTPIARAQNLRRPLAQRLGNRQNTDSFSRGHALRDRTASVAIAFLVSFGQARRTAAQRQTHGAGPGRARATARCPSEGFLRRRNGGAAWAFSAISGSAIGGQPVVRCRRTARYRSQ